MFKKRHFFIVCFLWTSFSFGQSKQRTVELTIVNFYDTIISEPTAVIKLRLTNTSDTIIRLSSYFSYPGAIAIYVGGRKRKDTVDERKMLENMDFQPITAEEITKLKPGESKEYWTSLFGVLHKIGLMKVQVSFRLSNLNKTFVDPEADWITQYFNVNYKEYEKRLDKEYEESLKKASNH